MIVTRFDPWRVQCGEEASLPQPGMEASCQWILDAMKADDAVRAFRNMRHREEEEDVVLPWKLTSGE